MSDGRVIVVTGASSGIGEVAARRLAGDGAHIAAVGRNRERTERVARAVGGEPFIADFDRLEDVRGLAAALLERYPRIDVLLNNAGGLVSRREYTVDGHERTIQSNHLAPFLLTALLARRLVESAAVAPVRVITTGSTANRMAALRLDDLDWRARPWLGGWRAYGTAKLANILFARELAERLTGTGVASYSVHPGVVATRFGATSGLVRLGGVLTGGHYAVPAETGAGPLIALAAPEWLGWPNGCYFDRYRPFGRVTSRAKDPQLARDLWEVTADLVGVSADILALDRPRGTAGGTAPAN